MKRLVAWLTLPVLPVLAFIIATSVPAAAAPEDSLDQAVTELLAASRITGARNSYRSDNPNEYQRVRAYLDGGSRPTGNLTHLGLGLVLLEDARRELAPPPTTTDTTTTTTTEPDPPGSVRCTTENYWNTAANDQAWTYDECEVGTTIELRNTEWHCRAPLASLATNGLPLKVVSRWSAGASASIAVSTNAGCTGVPGTDINLIVEVINEGDALITDVFKTRSAPGPQNIRMTGRLEGGARNPSDHQDCIQLQGGRNNYLVNVECPNYDSGQATVQGAGGALFFSINNSQMTVLGGKYIGCNHSLNVHAGQAAAGSRIENAKFRSGNTSTAFCAGFNASPPCVGPGLASLPRVNVTCQRWNGSTWVNQ